MWIWIAYSTEIHDDAQGEWQSCVCDGDLVALFAKLDELHLQIGPCRVFELWRSLIVQWFTGERKRGFFDLQICEFAELLDEALERVLCGEGHGPRFATANGAIGTLFVLESVGVDAVVSGEHHVVVEEWRSGGGKLEGFEDASGGDDGIGGSNGRDDVLDDALSEVPCDAGDAERSGTSGSMLQEPRNVIWIVVVKLLVREDAWPLEHASPFNAVFG